MTFPDPHFYRSRAPLAPAAAAEIVGGTLVRAGTDDILCLAESTAGGDGALIFLEKMRGDIAPAAVAIVPKGTSDAVPSSTASVIEVSAPKLAFAMLAAQLFESRGENPDADDHPEPKIDPTAQVDPAASIAPGAEIGPGAIISAGAVIGYGCKLGAGTWIGPNASVSHAIIGERCRLSAGARIGEAGFGYTPGDRGPFPVPQLGLVRLGDEVDIGANTTVDRGTLGDTVIGPMSKIDNLCQIAHNCQLGRGVLVASQTGMSGSCVIGDFVMIGGQVGMADHLEIGEGAVLAAGTGLMRDVEAGAKVGGRPAKPMRQWMKEVAALERLTRKK